MADIVVTPQNSPFNIPGGSVTYGTVTIQPGGYMQMLQQTKLTVTSMIVQSGTSADKARTPSSAPKASGRKQRK